MTALFADTFFFLAILNPRDISFHGQALELNRLDRPIVTTAWILLELAGFRLMFDRKPPS